MSTIRASRDRITGSLTAGGVRVATGGKFAAPCVLVEPGDPWTEPARMPGRLVRWKLTAVGGRADTEAAIEVLGELVDDVDAALRAGSRSISLPSWAMPVDLTLGGVAYAASVAAITDTDSS